MEPPELPGVVLEPRSCPAGVLELNRAAWRQIWSFCGGSEVIGARCPAHGFQTVYFQFHPLHCTDSIAHSQAHTPSTAYWVPPHTAPPNLMA